MDKVERLIFNILICMWIGMVFSMGDGMIWVIVKYSPHCVITQSEKVRLKRDRERQIKCRGLSCKVK